MARGNWLKKIGDRLNVHPSERRPLLLSSMASFFMLAFVIFGKSLREGLYLTTFDIKTLPYITAAVVVLSLPTVAIFTRLLGRFPSGLVLRYVQWVLALGLAVVVFLKAIDFNQSILVIAFYLLTALGALLFTSGFWIATSEQFGLRSAKRVFGLIGAGGTAGALTMGLLINNLAHRFDFIWLVSGLIILLLCSRICLLLMPAPMEVEPSEPAVEETTKHKTPIAKAFGLIWRTRHLRLIALIIFVTVVASTIIDFQFKELARVSYPAKEELTGFLGAFYGWMGGIALVIQLICSTQLITRAGIARSLALMPSLLLVGSLGFLVLPVMKSILLVRGVDESLRKSLHRQLIELLYVPIPATLRRQTKTVIDSVVDSGAEGFGAFVIFLVITLGGLDSRYLSVLVILCAVSFIFLSRRMGATYLNTIVTRLQEGEASVREMAGENDLRERNLLTANISQVDLTAFMSDAADLLATYRTQEEARAKDLDLDSDSEDRSTPDYLTDLKSTDNDIALAGLESICREGGQRDLTDEEATGLIRSLARDALYHQAVQQVGALGEKIAPHLAKALLDPNGDFVIRRRIPTVLARVDGEIADDVLLDSLKANRFEIRFRAALALANRRKKGLARSRSDWQSIVWQAIREEVFRERPIWELSHLLDKEDLEEDEFVSRRVGRRGELSLEHTFRLLTLVGDPEPVRATYYGIVMQDQNLNNYALEYLEQILPADIRKRLWLFIGDVSEYNRNRSVRPIDRVVDDLMSTRATLFAGEEERKALLKLLSDEEEDS